MSSSDSRRALVVRCPTCNGDSRFEPGNPWRPFCSERCKSIDLGAWATERYRVAGPGEAGDPGPIGDTSQDTRPH
jgi:uncharacterized protein